MCRFIRLNIIYTFEPWHEISNNVVCATSKGSDQPAHSLSLIRAFARRLTILQVVSYWLERTQSNVQQNIDKLQDPTMGVTIDNESLTTEPPP